MFIMSVIVLAEYLSPHLVQTQSVLRSIQTPLFSFNLKFLINGIEIKVPNVVLILTVLYDFYGPRLVIPVCRFLFSGVTKENSYILKQESVNDI